MTLSTEYYCKNGIREYALAVMKVLDPNNSIFESRLIARNDVPELRTNQNFQNDQRNSKDIGFVLPGYTAMGIAVDDNPGVWREKGNVVQVTKFSFWNVFWSCHVDWNSEGLKMRLFVVKRVSI